LHQPAPTGLSPLSLHDALPISPVVHEEPERGIGLGLRVGRDALLLAVAGDRLALCEAGAVLAAQGRFRDPRGLDRPDRVHDLVLDRKSTRLNSSHVSISYAVFC